MDIFDRLGELLRSFLNEPDNEIAAGDTDYADALEELNRYMEGSSAAFERHGLGGRGSRFESTRGFRGTRGSARRTDVPEELRQDYRNLELEFGAPMEAVRKKYRGLMVTYHPDRFASDPRKVKIATEITKKLGESYRRIREYHERTRR